VAFAPVAGTVLKRSARIGRDVKGAGAVEQASIGSPMFRVKICGICDPADARLAADAGADAVGLNFVPGSPRFLDAARAEAVAAGVPAGVLRVGVFAGAEPDVIRLTVQRCGLHAVQLHGLVGLADPATLCRELDPLPVIRTVRLEGGSLAAARRWIAEAESLGHPARMVLLDAAAARGVAAGRLGGTGETVDWLAVGREPRLPLPLALAGGLRPENVAEAVAAVRPGAVDVASGVESGPGRKDAGLVRSFVAAARAALAARG
jgi:phosphoribosylanthranilate isomerase